MELQQNTGRTDCHLWFFGKGLPGYAWVVPKEGSWVNVGIGAAGETLKRRNMSLQSHWEWFVQQAIGSGYLRNASPRPAGYTYYLAQSGPVSWQNAHIIGDAAGLATLDMGEGIGPAIQSGLLAADAICRNIPLDLKVIPRYSLPAILFPGRR
jgi:flavin-dependent dehydrogenase